MESRDEVLRHLDEFSNNVEENPTIPEVLENFLTKVAKTGETLFPWEKLKALVIHKADQAMKNFDSSVSMDTFPTYPNVENATFEQLRLRILKALKSFSGAPFTIQRIAELITEPRKHYKRTDKFLRGIEKNVNIVTTVDPFGIRLINDMVVVNGTEGNGEATPDRNTSLFVPPAPMNSPVTSSTATPDTASRGVGEDSSSTSLFKALTTTSGQSASSTVTSGGSTEETPTQSSGSLFSVTHQDQQTGHTVRENGDSGLNQDTSRVDTTSSSIESNLGQTSSQSDPNTAINSTPATQSTGEAESTGVVGYQGTVGDLRGSLAADKVTVCVDTNEDEDVDVTNSDDDKMDSSPDEGGVKREAAAASIDNSQEQPPVKKQRPDDQQVATSSSSIDIPRRESGGFEPSPVDGADSQSAVSSQSDDVTDTETATQHSDVSSSVSQSPDNKDRKVGAACQSESETKEDESETKIEVDKSESEAQKKESESETKEKETEIEDKAEENGTEGMKEESTSDESEITESKDTCTDGVDNKDDRDIATTTEEMGEAAKLDTTNKQHDDDDGDEKNVAEESKRGNEGGCEADSAGEVLMETRGGKEGEQEEDKTKVEEEKDETIESGEGEQGTNEEPMDTD